MTPPRIVLLMDNKNREQAFLQLLHATIKQNYPEFEVYILGSIADIRYTCYQLSVLKPSVVVIAQVFEQSCRQIITYAKQSGAIVALLPAEIRTSLAYTKLVQSDVKLNELVDIAFMPGQELTELFKQTDLNHKKLLTTGSPKIDLALAKEKMSRTEFMTHYQLNRAQKNVFVFTSFVETNLDYMRQDPLFSQQLAFKESFNHCVQATRKLYQQAIANLAQSFPSYNIVIKPHPLEKKPLAVSAPNVHLISDATIDDCLRSIDLAIHWTSTVALECWLHHIPVIEFFPTPDQPQFLPNFTQGNPLYFNEPDLMAGVKKYLNRPVEANYTNYQSEYLTYAFHHLDGHASYRVARGLSGLLKHRTLLNYHSETDPGTLSLAIAERLLGHKISRLLLKQLQPNYQAQYVIDNYFLAK
jgi:surface carbohydrate biosynthesis protein